MEDQASPYSNIITPSPISVSNCQTDPALPLVKCETGEGGGGGKPALESAVPHVIPDNIVWDREEGELDPTPLLLPEVLCRPSTPSRSSAQEGWGGEPGSRAEQRPGFSANFSPLVNFAGRRACMVKFVPALDTGQMCSGVGVW